MNPDQWTREQKDCHVYGHQWDSFNVTESEAGYTVTQRCIRCLNERGQVVSRSGYAKGWAKRKYQAGYLQPPGSGRLDADDRAVLRIHAIAAFLSDNVKKKGEADGT